jgi:ABC-type lipoprotein export system ATPase subunit
MEPIIIGAHWLKCDLHMHTPFDKTKNFKVDTKAAISAFDNGNDQLLRDMAYQYFYKCRDNQLDLIYITDHNSLTGYKYFKNYLEKWEEEANYSLIVLPGIEITAGTERNLHILLLLPEDADLDRINEFLVKLFDANPRFDSNQKPVSCNKGLSDFITCVREWFDNEKVPFLLIPAHINRESGIDSETRSASVGFWQSELGGVLRTKAFAQRMWAGFQIRGDPLKIPEMKNLLYAWAAASTYNLSLDKLNEKEKKSIFKRTQWPFIEASDPSNFDEIGRYYTWIKLDTPDIEGIRLALLDPESRLRANGTPRPGEDYPIIRKIKISHTDFFEEIEIPFNPNLNTIIGGRGSGKSAMIECMRYAIDRARDEDFANDEEEISENVKKLITRKSIRDFGQTSGLLLPNYQIEVDIIVANHMYRVLRKDNNLQIIPNPSEVDAQPIDLDVRALIAPRILSQRQIARIARNPAAQRRELDALLGESFKQNFDDKERDIVGRIRQLQVQRNTLFGRLEQLPIKSTELQKVNDQLSFLERKANADAVELYRAFEKEKSWLDDLINGLESVAKSLEDQLIGIEQTEIKSKELPKGPSETWLTGISVSIQEELNSTQISLNKLVVSLRNLKSLIESKRQEGWKPEYDRVVEAYDEVAREMQDQGIGFHLHQELLNRQSLLETEINELKVIPGTITVIDKEIKTIREELVILFTNRTNERRKLADRLINEKVDVILNVIQFGDKDQFLNLRENWFGGSGLQDRDWEIINKYLFQDDKNLWQNKFWNWLNALKVDMQATKKKGQPLNSDESSTKNLMGPEGNNLSRSFYNALSKSDRIHTDVMEYYLPEDWVIAQVRDAQGNTKPIEQGSIGLKSTAILSLLLSSGDQPLIIDQPEDDLDNKYIYDVVVNLLRKRKFGRQLIIATHNANIPVNGDAELIIAMGVENRLGKVDALGGIDRQEVKEAVSEIMEGSREAFRLRRERYGY